MQINEFDEIVKSDAPYSIIRENTWLGKGNFLLVPDLALEHGWGNGYVALPEGHPWYNLPYNDIENVEINGGLTFAEMINGMWVIGFDTAHSSDTLAAWPKEAVQNEADILLTQALLV